MKRLLLIDDHPAIRAGLRGLLQTEFPELAIEEANSEAAAFQAMESALWQVVILDINLPGRGGLELIPLLKQRQPRLRVLIYTMHPERQFGVPALRAGADGFLTKDSSPVEMFAAVRSLLGGAKYLSPQLAGQLAAFVSGERESAPHERLAPKERAVFRKLVAGCSLSQIAFDLQINVKTVSTYRARIWEKLCVANHSELMLYAVQHELIH